MAYLGTQPNNVKKNIGLYTPSEILQLTKDGSWGGSLELITKNSFSSVGDLIFTDIKEDLYNVHILNVTQECTGDAVNYIRLSNDGGSSYESSNYQYSFYVSDSTSPGGETRSAASTQIYMDYGGGLGANELQNFQYIFYNLGDANKYSFVTGHSVALGSTASVLTFQSNAIYTVNETINAIRVWLSGGTRTGTAELYGFKQ